MKGKITFWQEGQDYGFIDGEWEQKTRRTKWNGSLQKRKGLRHKGGIYVHITDILSQEDRRELTDGQEHFIIYDIVDTPQGKRAVNVRWDEETYREYWEPRIKALESRYGRR